MSKAKKTFKKILLGNSDPNIDFSDLRVLLTSLGFTERIKSSHHIYARSGVDEIINIQPKQNKAKVYQVRQIRNIILKYHLRVSDE